MLEFDIPVYISEVQMYEIIQRGLTLSWINKVKKVAPSEWTYLPDWARSPYPAALYPLQREDGSLVLLTAEGEVGILSLQTLQEGVRCLASFNRDSLSRMVNNTYTLKDVSWLFDMALFQTVSGDLLHTV